MSKGGSTTQSTDIPAWLEDAAKENINKGRDVASIGYTPYYGPEVAAFNPMQQQSMQSTGSAASAFGLAPQGFDATAGIPQAQTFAGGVQGYSSAPMFEQALSSLQQNRPGQFDAISNMFIDPFTGSAASNGSSASPGYANSPEQMSQMFSNSPTNFSQGGGNTSQGSQGGGGFGSDSSGYDRFPADNAGAFDYNNDMFTQSDTGAYYPVQEQAQLKDMMGGGVYGLMGDMLGGDSNPLGGALSAYADMNPLSDFINQTQYGMNKGSMNQYEAMSKSNSDWANMSEADRVNEARQAYRAGTPLPSAPAPVNVAPTPYQGSGIDPQSYISSGYDRNPGAQMPTYDSSGYSRFPNVEVSPLANNNIESLDLMSMLDSRAQQEAAKKRMAADQAAKAQYEAQMAALTSQSNSSSNGPSRPKVPTRTVTSDEARRSVAANYKAGMGGGR